ncbi:urease accessory protein UreD [Paracoccaceae bacterium GXU_MW_L88]
MKARDGRSALARLEQQGASRLLFPRRDHVEGIILNTAGGVTGGDRFQFRAEVQENAALTLTTQGAERLYKAQDGETGRIESEVRIGPAGRLDWLPQETILFHGANVSRRFTANLTSDARFLFVEPIIVGRSHMGETVTSARFRDDVRLIRDGEVIFRDTTALDGNIAALMDRPAIGGGARAAALLLYAARDAEAHLERLRALCPATGGVSLLRGGLLAARLLAADGFALRRSLIPMLRHFTDLPRCWSL